ncbi:MAG: tetratricopeptide repeat protein [Desulfatibacillaceae bacterium]|nr:tetratricopeptide repeat protein [Desulfatibacillaceae bacterium]
MRCARDYSRIFWRSWLAAIALLACCSCALPGIVIYDDPLSAKERLMLGAAYEQEGRLDLAEAQYKRAARQEPLAHLFLGNVFFAQKDYDKAEKHYKTAIKKLPENPDPANNLAFLYCTLSKNLLTAKALAQKAIQLAPEENLSPYLHTAQCIEKKLGQQ